MKNSGGKIFYINDFCFFENDVDLPTFPMSMRRKTGTADKYALAALLNFKNFRPDEIVYASRFGEFEKLLKLINSYLSENEVSPTVFSGSVHNFPVGMFAGLTGLSSPYTALAAGENTVSSGLLTSILSVNENVLFCYADKTTEGAKALSCSISKTAGKIKCVLHQSQTTVKCDEFAEFIAFLSGKTSFVDFGLFSAERLA